VCFRAAKIAVHYYQSTVNYVKAFVLKRYKNGNISIVNEANNKTEEFYTIKNYHCHPDKFKLMFALVPSDKRITGTHFHTLDIW